MQDSIVSILSEKPLMNPDLQRKSRRDSGPRKSDVPVIPGLQVKKYAGLRRIIMQHIQQTSFSTQIIRAITQNGRFCHPLIN